MNLSKNQRWYLAIGVVILVAWMFSNFPMVHIANQENIKRYPALQSQEQETLEDLEHNLIFAQELLQEFKDLSDKGKGDAFSERIQATLEKRIPELQAKINKKITAP